MTLDRIGLQKFVGSLLLGIVTYFIIELGRTQEAAPEDWRVWATGVAMGALYRTLPAILTVLVALQDGRLFPPAEEEVIGDGKGKL